MKRLLSLVALFATLQASAQQVNPVPDYVFRNQMSVGRGTVTDTAAYFSIGPRYGANKGFMPPIVGDTATFSSGKRNGLLIFSVQKNKFLYWDSVRVQWSDMAGSSGTYITGTGITGYVPQFNGTTTIDTSALFTLGSRLGIGTTSFSYTSATSSIELNGTAGGILGFKRNDSARGYLWHTGDNMELANTVAGAISFNTNSATRGSISSAGVWRLHNLAGTGDRVVVASSNGTLSASTSVTGLVDTTTLSTRAWRQKGDDSLGAIIATKGSGTVTSVATGYGLSGGTITTSGTLLVDTLNISTRAWRQKGLDSLAALEVSGSGTTNYVPKFTAASTIGNSLIRDNGTAIGINVAPPTSSALVLHVSDGGIIGGAAQYTHFSTNVNYTTDWKYNITSPAARYTQELGAHTFHTAASGTAGNTITWAERLRITSGGNVGIGTATAGGKLTINSALGDHIQLQRSGQTDRAIVISGSDQLVFGTWTSPTQMALTTSGELLINTTTDAGDYKLQVAGNIYNTGSAVLAATSGNVGIGTASPSSKLQVKGAINIERSSTTDFSVIDNEGNFNIKAATGGTGGNFNIVFQTAGAEAGRINTAGEWVLNNTFSDAGDYKLQVVGNARVGTGKLDISSNTAFSMNVQRSGTSEVAGTFNNSNAILYLGAESSAGGAIFTGSSSYAAVIGSGANYPLQFATNNVTRATINTNGELLINTTTDNGDFKLQVNGNALISGSIKTANGASSTAQPWHLGSVVATNVQLDTANYVEVEINGVYYRLAIVTPL